MRTDFLDAVEDIVCLLSDFHATTHASAQASYLALAEAYAPRRDRAGAVARTLTPEELPEAKRLVQNTITPLVLGAPMAHRAYTKPRGYAGDFLMMMDIYQDRFEGAGVAQQALHKLFCNHPLSQGVVTRKDYVVRKLIEKRPSTITSVGCGPAVEVAEVARYLPKARWSLIDQDGEALMHASKNLGASTLLCVDMRALVRGETSIQGSQDFIYCLGLYDYLKQDTAVRLTQALFEALAPGGTLLIANAAGPRDYYFDPEFVLDWPLIYRTSQDMWGLSPEINLGLSSEPLGAYWLLHIEKP